MRIGDQVRVKIIRMVDEKKAEVVDLNNNKGLLLIKGKLKINNGEVKSWVIKFDKNNNMYIFGNSYFGKYNIWC